MNRLCLMVLFGLPCAGLAQEPLSPRRPIPYDVIERALRAGREPVAPIWPTDGVADGGTAAALRRLQGTSTLWPEGTPLARRRGRLVGAADGHEFRFTDMPDDPPIALLRNAKLDQMLNYVEASEREVEFRIMGLTTEFEGQNFLLVREVNLVNTTTVEVAPTPESTGPAVSSSVLQSLVAGMETARPVTPNRQATAIEAVAARLPEDTHIVGRSARLLPDGSGWQLVFESTPTTEAEPPLSVLPNLALAEMLELNASGRRSVVFVVTGDVTAMRGQNFILLRRFNVRPDDGNLR